MDSTAAVKQMLADLADHLDGPTGPGSGAVCLAAIAEIEILERLRRPPDDTPD